MTSLYNKKAKNKRKQDFLLTFFSKPDANEHREVNGFILHKYFSNSSLAWEVAIYTSDSWQSTQDYLKKCPISADTPHLF